MRLQRSDAARPKCGHVHFGPGAFFRAFVAGYSADAMAAHGGDWGICAVSLRSASVRDALREQGWAYTSVSCAPDRSENRVIEVIDEVLVAPENPQAVLARLCDPAVKIVSLTITEKGYCHNPATGRLRMEDADIRHDLTVPETPRTAIGFITHALRARRDAGVDAFTVVSCDNLPDNGALTRGVVLEFARALPFDLADWIADNVRFPATMVDRITPATTQADIEALREATGYLDEGCVVHEPFRQWVIEDDFTGGSRPAWDAGGAQFVGDVAPFELMKLRCLNGTHSAMAYLGYLAGHELISQVVGDPPFASYIVRLWTEEIIPSLPTPEGEDLPRYCDALMERYQNPSIQHRTWQIAMDGTQKLPQRLLGTVRDNLAAGRPIGGLSLAVAGWMRYVGDVDEAGAAIDVRDPMAAALRAASDSADAPKDKAAAFLAIADVFAPELAQDDTFRDAVIAAYIGLVTNGARAMVERAG